MYKVPHEIVRLLTNFFNLNLEDKMSALKKGFAIIQKVKNDQ